MIEKRITRYGNIYIRTNIYVSLLFWNKVPAPRQLTLERQLNKSILIGWTAPDCQVIYISKTLYINYMRSHVFYLLKRPILNKEYLLIRVSSFSLQLGQIEMYHVYVDGFLRTTVRASDKTRALVEGVDCARVSLIWLYSRTSNRYGDIESELIFLAIIL